VERFQVARAHDGEQGIDAIGKMIPDLVVLDLGLPKKNGLEVLEHIRTFKDEIELPVIVFTNGYMAEGVEKAWDLGANKVLIKSSCTPKDLIDVVLKTLAEVSPRQSGGQTQAPAEPQHAYAQPTQNGNGGGTTEFLHAHQVGGNYPPPMQQQVPVQQPVYMQQAPPQTEFYQQGNTGFITRGQAPQGYPPQYAPPPPRQDRRVLDFDSGPDLSSRKRSRRNSDDEFEEDIRMEFVENVPDLVNIIRSLLQKLNAAEADSKRLPLINSLYRKVHGITGNAGLVGLKRISKLSAALEAFLEELYDKPNRINQSSLRTLAQVIDLLARLLENCTASTDDRIPEAHVLMVDDEVISRRAVMHGLKKARVRALSLDCPEVALSVLKENQFDTIITDVDMPSMDGFEFSKRVRSMPMHEQTPILFVTSLSDFANRAKSALAGGNDLIGKPFSYLELAVKVLTFVLRKQLEAERPDRELEEN